MLGFPFLKCFLICLLCCASIFNSGCSLSQSFYDLKAHSISGKEVDFAIYKGKVLLVVNTASKCGFTPQYKELQQLYEKYKDRGFEILAFPSNDFNNQEPGTNAEIKRFCEENFGVTFTLFAKECVKGSDKQQVFDYLTSKPKKRFSGEVDWNFEKFLIDKEGNLRGRYSSFTNPMSAKLQREIEKLLLEK